MKFIYKTLGLITMFSLFLYTCSSDNKASSSYDQDLERLNVLKVEIETLAASSVCNENSECKYIAFGSKPCGGPWNYLVYSTSINTIDLENKVEQYNQLESIFNAQYGIFSDCSVTLEPVDVICKNNTCVAVY